MDFREQQPQHVCQIAHGASGQAAVRAQSVRTAVWRTGHWHARVMRSVRAVSSASPVSVMAL